MNDEFGFSSDRLYEIDQEQVEAEEDHHVSNPQPRSADDLKQIALINAWFPPRKLTRSGSMTQRDM